MAANEAWLRASLLVLRGRSGRGGASVSITIGLHALLQLLLFLTDLSNLFP